MPDALYRCRACGVAYVLRVMIVLPTIKLGSPIAPGGAAHGVQKKCKNKVFDLVGDAA